MVEFKVDVKVSKLVKPFLRLLGLFCRCRILPAPLAIHLARCFVCRGVRVNGKRLRWDNSFLCRESTMPHENVTWQ